MQEVKRSEKVVGLSGCQLVNLARVSCSYITVISHLTIIQSINIIVFL